MNVRNLYSHFAKHPEGAWIMIWPNALALYQFVMTHPVKRILDLGTGIGASSAVMALALKDKGATDVHIDTVDQFDKCIRIAKELIPDDLKQFITFHKATAKAWSSDTFPYQYFSLFDTLPAGDYDLIVNDGPGPFEENGSFIDLPNGTVHKMLLEEGIKPGTFIVFDGRVKALRSLERYFPSNFYVQLPKDKASDFNILIRKDNPMKLDDEMLAYMNKANYKEEEKK